MTTEQSHRTTFGVEPANAAATGKRTVSTALEVLMEALTVRQRQPLAEAPAQSNPEAPCVRLGSAAGTGSTQPLDTPAILAKRREHLGPNMALFFEEDPLHIVRGSGCELFDPQGVCYLDCINNVSHVGHAHPRVAAAVAQQLFTLNTNSRYLHEGLVCFAERLAATMPGPLAIVFPVCSGSEANDLAWRIACAAAIAQGAGAHEPLHVAVVDHAYHGHTSATFALSPYKFLGPGGTGRQAHVHILPCPDTYRGANLDGAAAARQAIAAARAAGGRLAAFFSESILSCGGQVLLPEGYLAGVYREMRAAGAVCVADEVQCGFARVGSDFWAFQMQDVVPDIVTVGKPIGNGFPMSALVTTRPLAASFASFGGSTEFFATFGGSTAAAAAGLAVLDVIRDERLQENAAEVGAYALQELRQLQANYPDVIGDVRGTGLMLGVEIVADAGSKAHAPALARHIKSHCKSVHHVLLSTEGPYCTIIKIKPPICFSRADVDRMVSAMAAALSSLAPEAKAQLLERSRHDVRKVDERRAALGC